MEKIIPDFSFRRWNMEDAMSLNCAYVNEALQCKKWAFAADVVRVYALYKEGGVYMDSDIFLKKRFDIFLTTGNFITFHECKPNDFTDKVHERLPGTEVPYGLQAAFMIGKKDNHFCKAILDYYYAQHFLNQDGSMNMRIAPHIYAEIAQSFGIQYINKKQELKEGIIIYDSKFLAATKRDECNDTFGVHRISHSWKTFSEYPLHKRVEKRLKHIFRVCKYYLLHPNKNQSI